MEGAYKDGLKTGHWVQWSLDGYKVSEGNYVAGEKQGIWVYYDEMGRPLSTGNYINNLKDTKRIKSSFSSLIA
jgi:antitoxin component YwqK of YwqJK toxin-antitoxin module